MATPINIVAKEYIVHHLWRWQFFENWYNVPQLAMNVSKNVCLAMNSSQIRLFVEYSRCFSDQLHYQFLRNDPKLLQISE